MAAQQGRSERNAEEVHTKLRLIRSLRSPASGDALCIQRSPPYVEALSDARTKRTDIFSVLQNRSMQETA